MARFERPTTIRFSHCDPAGIVFFPQYFVLFNGLVEDWVNEGLGLDYAALLGPRRVGLPTVQIETEFRAISRHGDAVTLGLELLRIGRSSFTLQLDCRAGAQLRVLTRQTLVSTDLDTHRAQALPSDLLAAMNQFQNGADHA
ncbi:4-hydroxybenzoyl-CoA thioesterase [Inhella inkyongensis]|uniref:4-hydroxybenzoyl-CoA thioesterase n=2 Tax=Inhella inkyongensis TaxID=392593 RepID=A0A840S527_9BURK|nr:thioesterase family protein [Inhella inkyongensis]MBB5203610.1 4-hydroxybenzoyl-CoA thioesterase [Inhella inkyongensis]